MTKSVRIENADISNHKVKVQGQLLNAQGEWVDEITSTDLSYPTQMVTQTIFKERRIIISEIFE